ncbi:hypothetical protein ACFL27_28935, partial [candidate division CSSED10-310 bacterium]
CGRQHARDICPFCSHVVPGRVKEVVTIRGEVMADRIFRTTGVLLSATIQNGELLWLYHQNGDLKREDNEPVMRGVLEPGLRFKIWQKATLIGRRNQLITITPDQPATRFTVDCYGQQPVFDTNHSARYWLEEGQLMRDGFYGPEYIGDVLTGQTVFWVGEMFGFGFYWAGNLKIAFVFDAHKQGINDTVRIPFTGKLLDSNCSLAGHHCWFFMTTQEGGETFNHCYLIRANGSIQASAQAKHGDGSWLSSIYSQSAAGNFLLAATDEGVVRIESSHDQLVTTRIFTDTEPFVNSHCRLLAVKNGLYVISQQEIYLLTIRQS